MDIYTASKFKVESSLYAVLKIFNPSMPMINNQSQGLINIQLVDVLNDTTQGHNNQFCLQHYLTRAIFNADLVAR